MWRHQGELGKIIAMNRRIREIGVRIMTGLLKNWRFLSLLAVSFVLLTLTSVLSHVGQSIGIVFLGLGLSVAAFLSSYWYGSRPNPECRNSKKFFSLLAANLIPFVLFWIPGVPCPGSGSCTLWTLRRCVFLFRFGPSSPNSGRLELMRDIVKTFFVLLALLGIAMMLQGLGSLTDMGLLDAMGRDLSKLFGGS